MTPPILAHVLGSADYGGVESMALHLVRHMAGFRHVVVNTGPPGPRSGDFEALGVPLVDAPYRPGRRITFLRALRSAFADMHPHRVLSYAFGNHAMVAYAATRAGVPRTFVRVAGDPARQGRRLKNRGLAHAARPFCAGEIAVSTSVADSLVRDLGIPRNRVTLIPNGCEVEDIAAAAEKARAGRADAAFRVAMISRMDDAKDHETLIAAVALARHEVPDLELLLVGDGPRRLAHEEQVRSAGLADRVEFLGARSDVPALLGQSDLMVHSTRTEGFPNVLIEAMAAKLPTIASDILPCREVLGDAGVFVPPGDAPALARAIVELARDEKRREELTLAGASRVARRFHISATARRYAEVLR